MHVPDFAPDVLQAGSIQNPGHADEGNQVRKNENRPRSDLPATLDGGRWRNLRAQHPHDSPGNERAGPEGSARADTPLPRLAGAGDENRTRNQQLGRL